MNVVFIFVFGAVMGSFFYVVGTRLPNNESLISPASHCTYCNCPLKWYHLIPIISFIGLRGKCHNCHNKLSLKYIMYEVLTGTLFAISYFKFGYSYEFFVSLILSSLVVLIFITDFKYMIILDSPLVVSGIVLFLLRIIFFGYKNAFLNLGYGLLVFLIMIFIGYIGKIMYKREALGGGDIKFSFILGMALGFRFAIIALIFSTFLALPYAIGSMMLKKENEVPFGPFLASSGLIVYFYLEKFAYVLKIFYL